MRDRVVRSILCQFFLPRVTRERTPRDTLKETTTAFFFSFLFSPELRQAEKKVLCQLQSTKSAVRISTHTNRVASSHCTRSFSVGALLFCLVMVNLGRDESVSTPPPAFSGMLTLPTGAKTTRQYTLLYATAVLLCMKVRGKSIA